MYTARIIQSNYPGEYVWENKPYCFADLGRDLPDVAEKAKEMIPSYEKACYDLNSRRIISWLHEAADIGATIKRFEFKDNNWIRYQ